MYYKQRGEEELLNRMKHYLQSLQQITTEVDFHELAESLQQGMEDSNVYVLGRRGGKILGYFFWMRAWKAAPSMPSGY